MNSAAAIGMSTDIVSTSRLAGAHCWAEVQLFEILGQWLHEIDDNDVVVVMGDRCAQHGLRAEAWRSRIATSPGIDPDAVVTPRSPDDAARLAALRAQSGDAATRMAQYERVTAHLMAQYGEHLAAVDPLVDAPTQRLLTQLLRTS